MKKLFSMILVICSLLGGNAYAEKTTLQNCYLELFHNKFNLEIFERNEVIIDTDTDKLTTISVFTDTKIERDKKEHPELQHQKTIIDTYNIIFKDKNYIKAEWRSSTTNEVMTTFIVDLNKKEIQTTYAKLPNLNGTMFCQ
jgi:hypothetical protein|tara:strand:- start:66 stop:488 length:423 start_codon:yes stop_codon:yes gene_type:complete